MVKHLPLLCGLMLAATALWPEVCRAQDALGGIRGSAVDADTETPLNNATVTIIEALQSTRTTADGLFVFPQVPPGRYTISVSKDGFISKAQSDVIVAPGVMAELRIALSGEIVEMEEFVVRGLELTGGTELQLLELRQESTSLQDAVSAELIKRAGSSTVAAALKLVVGTTVQDGKYAVIRGLSDRYTSTLLNGVRMPTADAEKRAVQLDQFPAALIENIIVKKTFTPDQQGDATGGSVEIKTKSIPEGPILSVAGGIEYNTQTTGKKFLTYKGGGSPTFGVAGSERDLPVRATSVPNFPQWPPQGSTTLPTHNYAQLLDAQTRAFAPVMGTTSDTVGPNYSFGINAGNRYQLADELTLGLLGTFSYRQKYQSYQDAPRRTVSGYVPPSGDVELSVDEDYKDTRGVDEVLWGASAGAGIKIGENHEISLTLLLNQIAQDEARYLEDTTIPEENIRSQTLFYKERSTSSLQLRGDHTLPGFHDIKVDWLAAHSTATQIEPDQRFFRTTYDSTSGFENGLGQYPTDHTLRIWRDIEETGNEIFANITVPFVQWDQKPGFVKFGPFYDHTAREYRQDSFTYLNVQGPHRDPPQWSDVYLDDDNIGLPPGSSDPNDMRAYIQATGYDVNYDGDQKIGALYAMAELPVTSKLKFTGGLRVEQTDLTVDVDSYSGYVNILQQTDQGAYGLLRVPDDEAGSDLQQTDFLPSIGATYAIITNLNLRLAWSQTIARPTFRELAPVSTVEFLGDDTFIGNPDLQMSSIDNYDVRLEWFLPSGGIFAVSGFYKDIQDPIEQITLAFLGTRFVQRVNYPEGKLYGFELEGRRDLDFLNEALKGLSVGANFAYIVSEVTLPPGETANLPTGTETRPMFGQPEYVANFNLVYQIPNTGTTLGLFYTMTGAALVSGETYSGEYIPNLWEEPYDNLDFSIEQKIGRHWTITFRAKNLTDPLIERVYRAPTKGNEITQSAYHKGIDFSIGATVQW